MKYTTDVEEKVLTGAGELSGHDPTRPRAGQVPPGPSILPFASVVVGRLLGLTDGQRIPLVSYADQVGTAALAARSIVHLHAAHIGQQVVLVFEGGDMGKPIIVGVLRESDERSLADDLQQVEVDADGQTMIVSAKQEVVLRCGKASITLSKAGKVIIRGTYVSSTSSGVNRLKGSSVEIN